MTAIIRKELADYFGSLRCLVLFVLVFLVTALTLYTAKSVLPGSGTAEFTFLRLYTSELSGVPFSFLLNFINFMALFFVPVIGVVLGFDAINRERSGGTLSRIMSQPVYRDSVINGKFLAGLIILSIMMTTAVLLVGGYGLSMITGVPPSAEEIIRLFIYLVSIIIFGAFWIGLSILFSILFRSLATSIICSIAIWLFFSFGMLIIGLGVAESPEAFQTILRISPNWLFGQASSAILQPAVRTLGTITEAQMTYMIPNPLSLGQSMVLIWPNLTSLVSLSVICFGISYILFMRQEIRAT